MSVLLPVDHELTLGSDYELWPSLVDVKGVFFDHYVGQQFAPSFVGLVEHLQRHAWDLMAAFSQARQRHFRGLRVRLLYHFAVALKEWKGIQTVSAVRIQCMCRGGKDMLNSHIRHIRYRGGLQ